MSEQSRADQAEAHADAERAQADRLEQETWIVRFAFGRFLELNPAQQYWDWAAPDWTYATPLSFADAMAFQTRLTDLGYHTGLVPHPTQRAAVPVDVSGARLLVSVKA